MAKANPKTTARILQRNREVRVGELYFLSSFYDVDGAWVRVLAKSDAVNSAGWPSSISIQVEEPVGSEAKRSFYAKGSIHTCNATNLHKNRADCAPPARRAPECQKREIATVLEIERKNADADHG